MVSESFCLLAGLLVSAPAAELPTGSGHALRVNERCRLTEPIYIITQAERRKVVLNRDAEVRVADAKQSWFLVYSGDLIGWVKVGTLQSRCAVVREQSYGHVSAPIPAPSVYGGAAEAVSSGSSPEPAASSSSAEPSRTPAPPCDVADEAACQKRCEEGDALSCHILGDHYRSVLAVAQSMSDEAMESALKAYTAACDGSHGASCLRLGEMHQEGVGVDADAVSAAKYFAKACKAGEGLGCTHLGYMVRDGRGLNKDLRRAAWYFHRACELRSASGCSGLGALYKQGAGVAASMPKAFEAFTKACQVGGAEAAVGCMHLGYHYELGQGVARDLRRALAAYSTACEHGAEYACKRVQALGPTANAEARPREEAERPQWHTAQVQPRRQPRVDLTIDDMGGYPAELEGQSAVPREPELEPATLEFSID